MHRRRDGVVESSFVVVAAFAILLLHVAITATGVVVVVLVVEKPILFRFILVLVRLRIVLIVSLARALGMRFMKFFLIFFIRSYCWRKWYIRRVLRRGVSDAVASDTPIRQSASRHDEFGRARMG